MDSLLWCLSQGRTSSVCLLLKDSRVKVNKRNDDDGFTPLSCVAYDGNLEIIKGWIASGREMDLGKPGDAKTDAIGEANKRGHTEVVTLLERFKENPEEPRHALRLEVGWYDEAAAEMFALVVFVSDGLLRTRDQSTSVPAARFFSIATQLPLELQMVLCYSLLGSGKEIIPGKDSAAAFRDLVESLLWASFFTSS